MGVNKKRFNWKARENRKVTIDNTSISKVSALLLTYLLMSRTRVTCDYISVSLAFNIQISVFKDVIDSYISDKIRF